MSDIKIPPGTCYMCRKGPREYDVIWGAIPTHDYTGCCSECLPKALEDLRVRKGSTLFKIEHYTSDRRYDPVFNSAWGKYYNKIQT